MHTAVAFEDDALLWLRSRFERPVQANGQEVRWNGPELPPQQVLGTVERSTPSPIVVVGAAQCAPHGKDAPHPPIAAAFSLTAARAAASGPTPPQHPSDSWLARRGWWLL